MPAFACWLLEGDARRIASLYERTRSAVEEQALPTFLQAIQTWTRAQRFVKQLPRGEQALAEYRQLCSPGEFSAQSDTYVYRHAPQLYSDPEPLRVLWGALLETYCLPWQQTELLEVDALPDKMFGAPVALSIAKRAAKANKKRSVSVQEVPLPSLFCLPKDSMYLETSECRGVVLGHTPVALHLRGWLAGINVRAMVYFEYLACGRRCLPFGHRPGEPFEEYIGYLTPQEVWHLALALRHVHPPETPDEQSSEVGTSPYLVDEVTPTKTEPFLRVVRVAAAQGLGLLCRIG